MTVTEKGSKMKLNVQKKRSSQRKTELKNNQWEEPV